VAHKQVLVPIIYGECKLVMTFLAYRKLGFQSEDGLHDEKLVI